MGSRSSLHSERTFSTRAFRTPGTGSGSELSRGYERKAVGGSKSLVDDEAELSDWVSELRTDPSRGGRGDESDGRRGRVRDRGSERETYPAKRSRRDGGSDEFGESRSRGGFRSPTQSFPRNSRMSKRDDDDNREGRSFPPRNNRGSSSSNDRFGESNRKKFPSSNPSAFTRNPRMDRRFDNKFGDNGVKEDEFPRRNNRGNSNPNFSANSNSNSLTSKRGGREIDSGFRRNQGGEGLRKGGRDSIKEMRVIDDSDKEENEFGVGIGDLLTEEDSDAAAASDEDDGYEVLKQKSTASLFGSDKEVVGEKVVPKSSSGDSDSYLSETR